MSLLGETQMLRCYWLDQDGIQRSDNVMGTQACKPRFPILLEQHGSDASECGYFARAIAHSDAVQTSRAHLQRGFGVACVTLAVTAPLAGMPGVLCCDLAWQDDSAR